MEGPGVDDAVDPQFGERRSLYEGFGDALASGVELAVTPFLFVLLGLWLDGRFGSRPVLTIACTVVAFAGLFVKTYYRYVARMEREEAGKPWMH